MINNPGILGQQVPPSNQVQLSTQVPQQPTTSQMISSIMNPAMSSQARQNQNDEILARCLVQTQRLRESLQALLDSTKQAANIESDEQNSLLSSGSSSTANTSTNATIRLNIDRKLYDMSVSLDQLAALIDQYDFKFLQSQLVLVNHYNELSYEKQGTFIDEWSMNVRWANKLTDILPIIYPATQLYRRSNYRNLNPNIRSRTDASSSTLIERSIAQFESTQQQNLTKDHSINLQRLSEHLNIIEISLFRSGLDIYLYVRNYTVEHVVVKPLNEKKQFANNLNNKLSTNYRALDIIAGHIRAAAIHYSQSIIQSDQGLQKLLAYIFKYQYLHSQKCVHCQKYLLNGLQPTWRDFKTCEPYHEECLN